VALESADVRGNLDHERIVGTARGCLASHRPPLVPKRKKGTGISPRECKSVVRAAPELLQNGLARQMPSNPEAVRSDVAMRSARCLGSVEVNAIRFDDDPQLANVQVSVDASERVERPRHLINSLLKGAFALSKLQSKAEVLVAMGRIDGEHVRVEHAPAGDVSRKTEDEAHERVPVECSDENPADFARGDQLDERCRVLVPAGHA